MAIIDSVRNYIPQYTVEGITDLVLSAFVDSTIALYSRYFPRFTAATVVVASSNTSYSFAVPSGWEPTFSKVVRLEYPLSENPPEYLDSANYELYRDPADDVEKILFIEMLPVANFGILYTRRWSEASLSDFDQDSVALLATATVCDRIAARNAGSTDPLISADVVNYKTKTDQYINMKKQFLQLFCMRTGVDPKTLAPTAAFSYSSIVEADSLMSGVGTGLFN